MERAGREGRLRGDRADADRHGGRRRTPPAGADRPEHRADRRDRGAW
ncbi:hypothetical protein [Nocardioides convexus]